MENNSYLCIVIGAKIFGVSRHRIGIDGKGITTLVTFCGCPLRCAYCLNPQCFDLQYGKVYTPEQLYAETHQDNLYFIATEGGICFGGGEPLLQADFIVEFRNHCGRDWRLTVETSLNVDASLLEEVLPVADEYIVDVKDMDPSIYKAYTGHDNRRVVENLKRLVEAVSSERVMIRLPIIPMYNTPADRDSSKRQLQTLGFTRFDEFDYVVGRTPSKRLGTESRGSFIETTSPDGQYK